MKYQKISFLLLCGLAIIAILLGNMALTAQSTDQNRPRPKVSFALATHILRIEQDYIFKMPAKARADQDEIHLIAQFPDFRPPGSFNADKANRQNTVMITLKPMDESRGFIAPEDRPSRLYARYLKPEIKALENGLLQRQFEKSSPYESEDLYIAPPDGRDFYARCSRTANQADKINNNCFTEIRLSGLEIRILYAPELLGQWQALGEGVRSLITQALKEGKETG